MSLFYLLMQRYDKYFYFPTKKKIKKKMRTVSSTFSFSQIINETFESFITTLVKFHIKQFLEVFL